MAAGGVDGNFTTLPVVLPLALMKLTCVNVV